ncbi:MAG: radical SAM family heme chaperone HemW [Acidimicrobiia bacterium]|nr:radical SAM family heme chaperone HemW [Acidimicrobiia bacterium]
MLAPDSVELADLAAEWRSAYVHIPFCRRRCPYCDFAVVAPGDLVATDLPALTDRYLAALHNEIDMEPEWEPLAAVNFGGGTPSAIGAASLGAIIAHLDARFSIVSEAEVSIEANPEDIDDELVAGLVGAGVNRISLGVQSFDDDVLAALGRSHNAAQAVAAIEACLPHLAVAVDLIFGTPGESLESWRATVDQTLALSPHHLSAYALTVETGTELWKSVRAGAVAPDADDQADKYEYLMLRAGDANLIRYEVSNYARTGHACRYNLATWGQGEYLGFGLGAHGHRDGVRRRNVRAINAYVAAIEAGEAPEAGAEVEPDREMERLILGLRRTCGVDLGEREWIALADPGVHRLVTAGVVAIERGRMVVQRPLLTDEVGATVLSLSP